MNLQRMTRDDLIKEFRSLTGKVNILEKKLEEASNTNEQLSKTLSNSDKDEVREALKEKENLVEELRSEIQELTEENVVLKSTTKNPSQELQEYKSKYNGLFVAINDIYADLNNASKEWEVANLKILIGKFRMKFPFLK